MIKKKKLKKKNKKLEIIKWSILSILVIILILKYIFYFKYSNYYYNIILTSSILLIIGIFLSTQTGKFFINLAKESIHEIKSITWPNLKETFNITLTVIIVTILLSLILWGLDNISVILISFITSIRL
ncbi:MAG: preprotein translocase subunit SecE [Buchnera aphidicola (Chaetogeoica yunlongensis)]